MLLGGDEIGRTQHGNNNAYCQDNEISWFDWGRADESLLEFTRRLIHFYREHPAFRRRRWFQGRPIHGAGVSDIAWFIPGGSPMEEEYWGEGFAKSFGAFLNGEALTVPGPKGERIVDDSFYLMFNAHHERLVFKLPSGEYGKQWAKILETREPAIQEAGPVSGAGQETKVEAWSLSVFRRIS